jgi:hypothetical protein
MLSAAIITGFFNFTGLFSYDTRMVDHVPDPSYYSSGGNPVFEFGHVPNPIPPCTVVEDHTLAGHVRLHEQGGRGSSGR